MVSSTFTTSLVHFLKLLLSKERRDCLSIKKTHMDRILDGALFREWGFDKKVNG